MELVKHTVVHPHPGDTWSLKSSVSRLQWTEFVSLHSNLKSSPRALVWGGGASGRGLGQGVGPPGMRPVSS